MLNGIASPTPRPAWALVQTLRAAGTSKHQPLVLRARDGTLVTDTQVQSAMWRSMFEREFAGRALPPAPPPAAPVVRMPCSPDEHIATLVMEFLGAVPDVVQFLTSGRATGKDEVPAEFMKSGARPFALDLGDLLRKCCCA